MVGERLGIEPAREAHATVEPERARELLQAGAIGPLADDHAPQLRLAGGRLEQQIDALGAVEPADGQHVAALTVPGAVGQWLRRRRQHLRLQAELVAQPGGHVARDGEERARLAQRDAVEPVHGPPLRPLLRAFAELPQLRAVEVVGLAELVHEPDGLAAVPDHVRGELGGDHGVDRSAVRLLEVEQPPEEGLGEHAGAGYHVGTVTRSAS